MSTIKKESASQSGAEKSKINKAEKPEEGAIVSMAKKDVNGGATKNYSWVEGTGKSKYMPKGKKFEVQNDHAEHLIKKGAAKKSEAPKPVQPKAKIQTDEDDD